MDILARPEAIGGSMTAIPNNKNKLRTQATVTVVNWLCQRLRDDPRYAETPIIFLTAKKLEVDLRDLKLAKIIGKPFSLALMVKTVDETRPPIIVAPP